MKTLKRVASIALFGASIAIAVLASISATSTPTQSNATLRPPAVPLVACDPYFSIWSPADKLTDADTIHWTGKSHRLTSLVRIDGKGFRVMGKEPGSVPALPQTNLEVLPTRTIYTFEGEGVRLTLTFMTPALPEDLEVLARPVTYVTWQVKGSDGREHNVETYLDAAPEISINNKGQAVKTEMPQVSDLDVVAVGSADQPVLEKKGDDLRIDWGRFYMAAKNMDGIKSGYEKGQYTMLWGADAGKYLEAWAKFGGLASKAAPGIVSTNDVWPFYPTFPRDEVPVRLVSIFKIGSVGAAPVSRWLMLAYDDEYSIQYMKKNLRPYWRRNGDDAAALLKKSAAEYESLKKRCEAFDTELMADLRNAGGEKYAQLSALAYRQCFAGGKFVADANGQPLQFCKENHSNGCIGTSDVFYPMSPQFLLFGPTLAKSFLVPFMNYAASERWKFPFAPHDLGTYPHANGQMYGGGERNERDQMPVEESGNLLILMAAIAQMEGNANFAGLYWKQLEQWAEYLKAKGFDPENQLCTDDFAGHLAHNVNLSAKAIIGLGSFAKLCEMRAKDEQRRYLASAKPATTAEEAIAERDEALRRNAINEMAAKYKQLAVVFASRWDREADDGDHFRLAFDRPGTWSQKYNLMWDRILGLNLFPAKVARKEMDYYKRIQNKYGLPLDNRETYTKLDWITWTATLTQNRSDFEGLIDPVFAFLNETPDRAPMTDWYQTRTAKKVGFTARPVVGGVFAQLLYDKAVWQKWASRDQTKATNWAPIPPPPKLATVVPAADKHPEKCVSRPPGPELTGKYEL